MQAPVIQLAFVVAVACVFLPLKVVSVARAPNRKVPGLLFWLAPLPALGTWQRRRAADAAGVAALLRTAVGYAVLTAVAYGLYWMLVPPLRLPTWQLSYAAALPALLSWLVLGPLAQLCFLPLGLLLPPLQGRVLGARSVGEFWSRGWNRWMSEWFRDAVFLPRRRSPRQAAFGAFLVSGVLHEVVINGPGYALLGTQNWGRILGYFLLQWVGLVAERRLPGRYPGLRRAFAWGVVLVPLPLFLAEPMLRILFLWPY